jgi:hypothetical protein
MLHYQSSSKIWKVFSKTVSMTRACQPASAMFPLALAPRRVGLFDISFDLNINW